MPDLMSKAAQEDKVIVHGKLVCDRIAELITEATLQGNLKPVVVLTEPLYTGMKAYLKDKLETVEVDILVLAKTGNPLTGASFNKRPVIVTYMGHDCPMVL